VALRTRLTAGLPFSQREDVPAALMTISVLTLAEFFDMPPGHFWYAGWPFLMV